MTAHLRLKKVVGQIYSVNPDDVLTVKTALQRVGLFDDPELGITPFPEERMFDGIKKLQKERGLVADGVMAPRGPTEHALDEMLRRPNDVRKQAELAKFDLDAATDGRRNLLSSVGRVGQDDASGSRRDEGPRAGDHNGRTASAGSSDKRMAQAEQGSQSGQPSSGRTQPTVALPSMVSPLPNPKIRRDKKGFGDFGENRKKTVIGPDGKPKTVTYKHQGVDLKAPPGSAVRSPVDGTVERIGDPYGDGRFDIIWIKTKSGHRVGLFYVEPRDSQSKPIVKPGDSVTAGKIVGTMQNRAAGIKNMDNHLHLKIIKDGKAVDPTPLLRQWGAK